MKKYWLSIYVLGVLIMLVNSCTTTSSLQAEDDLHGKINISGAFAIYPLLTRWSEEFQRLHPGVSFDIASVGAEIGMSDVLAGKVDIGMVSREITEEEKAKGAYPLPIGKDAVFPLVNENNPILDRLLVKGITRDVLKDIFITGRSGTWGEIIGDPSITDEIHVYTRADICGAGAVWGLFLGGVQEDLLGDGKWGDPGIIQALQKDPLGIGYNNLIYAYGLGNVAPQNTVIVPIDLNHNGVADPGEILDTREEATNAIASGLYPSPPSRTLYLVTNGKPKGVAQVFLKWILTDGRVYLNSLGYVQLPNEQVEETLSSIQ